MLITGNRYSYAVYTGDGITDTFTVHFPYLSKSFIDVSVDDDLISPSSVLWLSDSMIRIVPTPAKDSTVRIQRNTEKATPLVDFSDGSILTEQDLDTSTTQTLHIVQEAYDIFESLNELLEQLATWQGGLAIFYQVQQALYLVYDFLRRADPNAPPPETANAIFCGGASDNTNALLIDCNGANDDGSRSLIGGMTAVDSPGSGILPELVGIILGGGGACGFAKPPDVPGGGGGGDGPNPPGPDGEGVFVLFCGNAPTFTPDYVIYCGNAGVTVVDGTYNGGGADVATPSPDPGPNPDPDPKPDPGPDPEPDPKPDPDPTPDPGVNILFCGKAPIFIPDYVIHCGLAGVTVVDVTYSCGGAASEDAPTPPPPDPEPDPEPDPDPPPPPPDPEPDPEPDPDPPPPDPEPEPDPDPPPPPPDPEPEPDPEPLPPPVSTRILLNCGTAPFFSETDVLNCGYAPAPSSPVLYSAAGAYEEFTSAARTL